MEYEEPRSFSHRLHFWSEPSVWILPDGLIKRSKLKFLFATIRVRNQDVRDRSTDLAEVQRIICDKTLCEYGFSSSGGWYAKSLILGDFAELKYTSDLIRQLSGWCSSEAWHVIRSL